MRCGLGLKKIMRLRRRTGLPISCAMVRGNTNHRVDLCLPCGRVIMLYRDGSMRLCPFGWNAPRLLAGPQP